MTVILKRCNESKVNHGIRCVSCDERLKEYEEIIYAYGWFHYTCFQKELRNAHRKYRRHLKDPANRKQLLSGGIGIIDRNYRTGDW